jgi:hypothetical protein
MDEIHGNQKSESEYSVEALLSLKMRLNAQDVCDVNKHKHFTKLWEVLAGDQVEGMLTNLEKAKQNLQHPSWRLRLAAISILRERWKLYEELARVLEKMAFEDAHPQVRASALFSLACCLEGTNERIGQMLASVVKNPALSKDFRASAYNGLFRLRGRPASQSPMPGTYRVPEDVDWQFVDSFITTTSHRPQRTNWVRRPFDF